MSIEVETGDELITVGRNLFNEHSGELRSRVWLRSDKGGQRVVCLNKESRS